MRGCSTACCIGRGPIFQALRVGDSITRIRELENIRQFLTGDALTLLLDVAFSVISVAVMFACSTPLTLIVLISPPLSPRPFTLA
uniref:ABC transporter transmembrane domain-containing protein n=1 Tax=Roseateles oligotrophus TaxID=1769250 RepID=UPI0021E43070|nr:ABC transporter transmembrane domain-containing protein [Roseateles oligotrophus]